MIPVQALAQKDSLRVARSGKERATTAELSATRAKKRTEEQERKRRLVRERQAREAQRLQQLADSKDAKCEEIMVQKLSALVETTKRADGQVKKRSTAYKDPCCGFLLK